MRLLIKHEEIVEIAKKIGKKLTHKFNGKNPLIICVLKGACPFHSELIKHIECDMEVDYIQVSSYSGMQSLGVVKFKKDFSFDISNRDVVLVEDIIDTGITMSNLIPIIKKRNPNSITVVSMLDKPSKRKVDLKLDFVGKSIDDLFVVGFGLDLDEKYRNLKDIYVYEWLHNTFVLLKVDKIIYVFVLKKKAHCCYSMYAFLFVFIKLLSWNPRFLAIRPNSQSVELSVFELFLFLHT